MSRTNGFQRQDSDEAIRKMKYACRAMGKTGGAQCAKSSNGYVVFSAQRRADLCRDAR